MKSLLTALLAIPEDSFTASNASSTAYHIVSLVFIILMFVAALTAVILVLLQPGNSQGIDALGGSSETLYGKTRENPPKPSSKDGRSSASSRSRSLR